MTTSNQMPAVRKGTAGWVLRLQNADTGQVFTADLSTPAPDILPAVEDAYLLLPAFRAIATRARDIVTRLTDICRDDLVASRATERLVGTRLFRMETDSEWVVNGPALREALLACVKAGEMTEQELDDALPVIVTSTVKPSNTALNALSKRRGRTVSVAIDAHRQRKPSAVRIVEAE